MDPGRSVTARLILGDCLDALRSMSTASVDAIVCDPPAGIAFMGRGWDSDKGGRDQWVAWLSEVMGEALRVVKPGGHALAWALPRTSHWTGWALESAGWVVRDRIAHQFYSGFPKSLDVSKAIDAAAGAEREVVGPDPMAHMRNKTTPRFNGKDYAGGKVYQGAREVPVTAPATPEAAAWSGWGTALKPAQEDWYLCRAPLSEKTVAANVLRWGVGAIHVDACRYAYGDPAWPGPGDDPGARNNGANRDHSPTIHLPAIPLESHALGRWPANVYACPKPSRSEREAGCEQLPAIAGHEAVDRQEGSAGVSNPRAGAGRTADAVRNAHPT